MSGGSLRIGAMAIFILFYGTWFVSGWLGFMVMLRRSAVGWVFSCCESGFLTEVLGVGVGDEKMNLWLEEEKIGAADC